MEKIICGERFEKAKNKKMKDDKIVFQHFTCCNKILEKFLWEGWDWVDGEIIAKDIIGEFKYCPFCGKPIIIQQEDKGE